MTNATWTRKLGSHTIGSGDVRGEVTFDGVEYNAYAQNSNDSAYEYFKTLAQAKKWVEKFLTAL
jgi:hypothetical protein